MVCTSSLPLSPPRLISRERVLTGVLCVAGAPSHRSWWGRLCDGVLKNLIILAPYLHTHLSVLSVLSLCFCVVAAFCFGFSRCALAKARRIYLKRADMIYLKRVDMYSLPKDASIGCDELYQRGGSVGKAGTERTAVCLQPDPCNIYCRRTRKRKKKERSMIDCVPTD